METESRPQNTCGRFLLYIEASNTTPGGEVHFPLPGKERPMLVMTAPRTMRPRCPVCQPAAARRVSPAPRRRARRRRRSRRGPLALWLLALLLFAALAGFKSLAGAESGASAPAASPSSTVPALNGLFIPRAALLDNLPGQGSELLGGKTGYTSQAGLCLASLMEVDGQEYILVTTGAPGDHTTDPYHLLDALEVCDQLRSGILNA